MPPGVFFSLSQLLEIKSVVKSEERGKEKKKKGRERMCPRLKGKISLVDLSLLKDLVDFALEETSNWI